MTAAGRDCALVITVGENRVSLPFCEETLRTRYRLCEEAPTLESDGRQGSWSDADGATGCCVTRLTLSVVPLLFAIAFGREAEVAFVSETRSLWMHPLTLDYRAPGVTFDAVSDRVFRIRRIRELIPLCWELRIRYGEALHFKLDAEGDYPVEAGEPEGLVPLQDEECFREPSTRLTVNGRATTSAYGVVVTVTRGDVSRTEIRVDRRADEADQDLFGERITELEIDARLLRDEYEERHKGRFVLRATDLLLFSEEAKPDSASEIIGGIRYIVAGRLEAEVYTRSGERLLP